LVQRQIHLLVANDHAHTVDAHHGGLRIDAQALLAHDLAVDLDATGFDHLLGRAARGHTGLGEHLLQALTLAPRQLLRAPLLEVHVLVARGLGIADQHGRDGLALRLGLLLAGGIRRGVRGQRPSAADAPTRGIAILAETGTVRTESGAGLPAARAAAPGASGPAGPAARRATGGAGAAGATAGGAAGAAGGAGAGARSAAAGVAARAGAAARIVIRTRTAARAGAARIAVRAG